MQQDDIRRVRSTIRVTNNAESSRLLQVQLLMTGDSIHIVSPDVEIHAPSQSGGSLRKVATAVDGAMAFYVSPEGSDLNDGTQSHPFATLARAVQALKDSPIRTIYVEHGTYTLTKTLEIGSAESGSCICAAPGQTAILDGDGASTLIKVEAAHEITISGLAFWHTAPTAAAVVFVGGGSNRIVGNLFAHNGEGLLLVGSSENLVSGNEIDDSTTSAIEAKDGSNNNLFDSNLIDGTGARDTQGGGFFLHGVSGNTISDNLVCNTAGMAIGIENWDSGTLNLGNVVAANRLLNTDTMSTDSGAIYILGRSQVDTRTVIVGNEVDGTGSANQHSVGIYLDDSTSGVLVAGNVIRNIGSDAVQIHGGDNNVIRGNIFDLGSGTPSAVLFQAAPSDTSHPLGMVGNVVRGNILYSKSPKPRTYAYIDGGAPEITGNFYFNTKGIVMTTVPPTADASPLDADPGFRASAMGDYRLLPQSAAARLGFDQIDQSAIGLHPVTVHWY